MTLDGKILRGLFDHEEIKTNAVVRIREIYITQLVNIGMTV